MSWKNWPAWLKGGVIGGGVYLLLCLFDFSTLCKFGTNPYDPCGGVLVFAMLPLFNFLLIIIGFIGSLLAPLFGYNPLLNYILMCLIGLIIYFLIGTLIGFIIQKIKSRKERK